MRSSVSSHPASSIDRHSIRDAIQVTNLDTVQGNIQFDENGDITDRTVSIFQVKHDSAYPNTDAIHQFKYVGSAPRPYDGTHLDGLSDDERRQRITHQSAIKTTFLLYKATVSAIGVG